MCRRIRVLWLIDSLTAGGAEALTSSLARSALASTLEIRVACLKSIEGNPFERELREADVTVKNLQARNLRDLTAFRGLTDLIETESPDLVHAHLTSATIWGALAARIEGLPLVATLHTLPEAGRGWSRQRLRQQLALALLGRYAAMVLAVSQDALEAYRAKTRLEPSLLRVLHNGVDVDGLSEDRSTRRKAWRTENQIGDTQRIVTTVSVLRGGKGIADLLLAAREIIERHPEVIFQIAGDGPETRGDVSIPAALGAGTLAGPQERRRGDSRSQ